MRREINLSGGAKYFVAQCGKNEKFSLTKKYFVKSTNSLVHMYLSFSKTVTFTKFFDKNA